MCCSRAHLSPKPPFFYLTSKLHPPKQPYVSLRPPSTMSSSTSSFTAASSPRFRCHHNNLAVVKTVKRGENIGRRYCSCPQWPPCKFFEWYVGEVVHGSEDYLRDKDALIEQLLSEKKSLEAKIERLRKKNQLQKEEKMKIMFFTAAILGVLMLVLCIKLGCGS